MKILEIAIDLPLVNDNLDEILTARLTEIGFEGFWTDESSFKAYVNEEQFNKKEFESIILEYVPNAQYKMQTLSDKNWNEQWESSYEPVFIGDRCVIKAPFHNIEKKYPLEILINPKMAFGTGHHNTTKLIIERLFDLNLTSTSIIDAGCGSGILAIAAEKLGAESVLAYDIDQWSVENTNENIELNHCHKIKVEKGTISELNLPQVNIILANINRNVLIEEIKQYKHHLLHKGILIVSGFIKQDVDIVGQKAISEGLMPQGVYHIDEWYCLVFKNE
ncbi:MAG: 50S ribosomal protein L11 methyltransferase [Bacteroidales bacterium]